MTSMLLAFTCLGSFVRSIIVTVHRTVESRSLRSALRKRAHACPARRLSRARAMHTSRARTPTERKRRKTDCASLCVLGTLSVTTLTCKFANYECIQNLGFKCAVYTRQFALKLCKNFECCGLVWATGPQPVALVDRGSRSAYLARASTGKASGFVYTRQNFRRSVSVAT